MTMFKKPFREKRVASRFSQWTLMASALLMAACSSPHIKVESSLDPHFNFSHLHEWNWAPKSSELKTPAAITTAERIQLESLVNGQINTTLGQKGFRQQTNKPEFLVAWSFGEWELSRKNRPNEGYGSAGLMYPGLHGSNLPVSDDGRALPPSQNPYSAQYEEAKLEIVMIDTATSKVIWNATVTDDTDFGYFRSSQPGRISAAVKQMLDGFPPGKNQP